MQLKFLFITKIENIWRYKEFCTTHKMNQNSAAIRKFLHMSNKRNKIEDTTKNI